MLEISLCPFGWFLFFKSVEKKKADLSGKRFKPLTVSLAEVHSIN